ncbi:excalibur calcium-binding domain-containing protein [Leekyejoonella antrihumi]|uniref:excalibur calcium-binding domain-containing protein n=1 Tax=Leekyejoonella antrihumi TaxID=1660198 RepID=UPI003CCC4C13
MTGTRRPGCRRTRRTAAGTSLGRSPSRRSTGCGSPWPSATPWSGCCPTATARQHRRPVPRPPAPSHRAHTLLRLRRRQRLPRHPRRLRPRHLRRSPRRPFTTRTAPPRAAGAAPIYRGQPGYSSKLDRDGVACE